MAGGLTPEESPGLKGVSLSGDLNSSAGGRTEEQQDGEQPAQGSKSKVDSKMGQNAVKTSENQDVLPLVGDQSHTQMVVCQQFPGPACVVKREMRLFSTNLGNKLGVWTQDVCFQQ
ncbi:unnamed protein product [Natator depressus]